MSLSIGHFAGVDARRFESGEVSGLSFFEGLRTCQPFDCERIIGKMNLFGYTVSPMR